jgi:hypothetical protein
LHPDRNGQYNGQWVQANHPAQQEWLQNVALQLHHAD